MAKEYIEREAAIKKIKEYAIRVYGIDLDYSEQFAGGSNAERFCEGLYEAIEIISDADYLPAVGAIEVIRDHIRDLAKMVGEDNDD